MVDQVNKILQNPQAEGSDRADGDLWAAMRQLIAAAPEHFFTIQWAPSHLNDLEHPNQKRKQKYLEDGTTMLAHIHGNAQADIAAGEGAAPHSHDADIEYDARIRAKLTRIA